jgi:hypothetical protein
MAGELTAVAERWQESLAGDAANGTGANGTGAARG